jgi:hypothetical protein
VLDDERQQSREGSREEHRDEKAKQEVTKEVRTQTVGNGVPRQQTPFDWATDVDTSVGLSPAALTQPAAIVPIAVDHRLVSTEPTPVMSNKPIPEAHVNALVDPAPVTTVNMTSDLSVDITPITRIDSGIDPATTVPVTPSLPTVRGPRDLSALRSGTSNPWGSIQHRRRQSHPTRDISSLRSSASNPWGSIHNRRRRFHPPRMDQPSSSFNQQSRSPSHLHPPHAKLPSDSLLHLRSAPAPVCIIQTIQHPRGISSIKPKITKNISTALRVHTPIPCCTCGHITPVHNFDRRSWRSMDTWRFRRGFSRRFWDRERGRSHLWGGHMW